MTVTNKTPRGVYKGPYAKDVEHGLITFEYLEKEYVKVATDKEILSLEKDYTIEGKNVFFKNDIPEGVTIIVYRQTPLDNGASFPQEAEFDSEKINDAVDKLTMIVQEQQDTLNRAVQIPNIVSPEDMGDGLTPAPSAGKALVWNKDGTYLVNSEYAVDELGAKADEAIEAAQAASKAASDTIDKVKEFEADTYTRSVLDSKLSEKQDKISVGAYLEMDATGTGIAVDLDSIMLGMREYDWNQLTYEERRNIPLALIYEQ